jgi:hypothetical protein
MVEILDEQEDFANQKPWLEEICRKNANHLIEFFPKFHPELNGIERYWSNAKAFARGRCDYTFTSLQTTVPLALNQVEVKSMRAYARKCFRYMNAYRSNDGQNHNLTLKQVEWTVKKYKSHRRISDTFDDIIEAYRIATTVT